MFVKNKNKNKNLKFADPYHQFSVKDVLKFTDFADFNEVVSFLLLQRGFYGPEERRMFLSGKIAFVLLYAELNTFTMNFVQKKKNLPNFLKVELSYIHKISR